MHVEQKCNLRYEDGTGGKVKEILGLSMNRTGDQSINFAREDGSRFSVSRRFIIMIDYYEEKSFD